MNKNGGKKLLAAVMALAMVLVAGFVIIGIDNDSEAETAPNADPVNTGISSANNLPEDGIIDVSSSGSTPMSYKVSSNVSLTITGKSSESSLEVTLYLAQGVSVTIIGAAGEDDNNVKVIIKPADKDCAKVFASDSKVEINALTEKSITVTNNAFGTYVGTTGTPSVMTVSNNEKATVAGVTFTQGDVRIGSSGLETTGSVTDAVFGVLVESSGVKKYSPVGASVSVTLSNGDVVSVRNGSATVTQTIQNKDNTISLSKVESADITIKGVEDSAGNYPTISGTADEGLITITTGCFADAFESSTQKFVNSKVNAVVQTKSETANLYMNQIPAEVATESLTYEIWGTITQVNDVNLVAHDTGFKDATLKMVDNSSLIIEEGVTVAVKGTTNGTTATTGKADIRVFGTYASAAVSPTEDVGTLNILLGSTGSLSGEVVATGNTNVRSGDDNPIGKNLYSELPEDAVLGENATIPEGTTYTLKANLGLNGKTLTVNGTLVVEAGCEIFGTGIASEKIILGQKGSIVNNGVIAAVTPITVSDGTNGAKIQGVSGIQFGYITVGTDKKISISGEIEAVGAVAKVEAVGTVYIGADLIIGDDVTFKSSENVKVQKGVDIIIDGVLEGTLNMGTVSEIQVNGKLADGASIVVPVGTSDRDASTSTGSVTLAASGNYVSGFAVKTLNNKTGTTTNPVYTLKAYISGSIVTSTAQDAAAATLAITGSAATQSLTVAEGVEVTIASNVTITESNATIIFDGTLVFAPRNNVVELDSYSGATYSVKNTTLNLFTTYYTNFADAVSAIAQADGKKVTANVDTISSSFTLNEKETVVLTESAKITSDAEVKVLQGAKLTGTISKVEGLLYIAKGVTGTTVADYDSKKVDSTGNTTYAGLKVALRDSNPGDVLTIKSANVTESLTVPAGVKIIVTDSLTVAGDLTIPEGSELVAPNVTVNGKEDNIADITVEGILDLSAGSVLGTYNAVYSTGTVILGTPSTNMNGAYYENADGKIVLTTIAKAVASGEDVTVLGTVTETSDVIVTDAVFSIASSAVVTVGSITLDEASIVNDGTLTTTVKAASGTDGTAVVAVSKTTAGFVASSAPVNGETVYALSIDKISGSVAIKEGAVTINSIVTAAEKSVLAIDEGAELIIAANTNLSTLNSTVSINGTVTVSATLTVTTNDEPADPVKIIPLVINGTMKVEKTGNVTIDNVTVLGTLEVVKNGVFTTEAMTVGKSPLTTGAGATVSGVITIDTNGYVKVYAGSVASVEGAKVASFSINGADYAVVYFNGTVDGDVVFAEDDFSVPGYEDITNPWTDNIAEKTYNKDLTAENVTVTVSIEPGTQLKIGALFYGTTGPIVGGLAVGEYSVSAKALPGYTETAIVELWIDNVKQDPVEGTITLTTDMIGKEVIIVSTFGTPVDPETPAEPSTGFDLYAKKVDGKVQVRIISDDGYFENGVLTITLSYTYYDDFAGDYMTDTVDKPYEYISDEETVDFTYELEIPTDFAYYAASAVFVSGDLKDETGAIFI